LKAVVIACNSASTAVLDCLRAEFEVPFVGVVPAIKPAALCSGNKKIGLLATQGTVTRAYIDRLINEFAADCEVVRVGSQLLVELAEQKLRGETVTDDRLLSVIQPLLQAEVDVVVLGCTHFPWFKADFQRLCPQITWLDSGQAIARRVDSLLPSGQKTEPLSMPGYCYFTGQPVMLEPQILAAAGIRFAEYRQF
jgi:glutamate racemase